MNYFGELPDEITLMILQNCDFPTLKALRKVNHQFHRLSNIDTLWKTEAEKIVGDNYGKNIIFKGKKCSKLDFSKETIIDWDNAPDHGFSSKGYKETYKIYKKNLLKMPKGEPIYLDVFECLCNDKCFHKSYVMCVVLLIPFSIASVICMIFGLVTLHIAGYNYQSQSGASGFFYLFTTAGAFFFLGFVLYFPMMFYIFDFTFLQIAAVLMIPSSVLCFSVFADGLGVRWLCVAGIPEFLFIILVPCALKIFIDGKQMEDGKMKLRVGTYLCNFIKLVGFVMNILKKDAGWNVPWSVAAIGNYLYFAVGAFFSFYIGRELDVTFFGIAICILNVAAEIVQILCALWMDGIIRSIAVALIPVDIVLAAFMFIAPYVVLKLLSAGLYDCYEDVEYNRIEENRRRKYGKIWKKKAKICDSMYLELKIH